MFSKRILTSGFVLLFGSLSLFAQGPFAPAAGQVGSTAIDVNAPEFVLWATAAEIDLGWMNNSDTTLGYAAVGTALSAVGKAGDGDVLSLGDGGTATFTFLGEVYNGPGFDFAIFENSFSDNYLELAHVEVSSDGVNFFRFPSTSLTDTAAQIDAFGTIDCTNINNLAGKYRGGFGTPFDLEELKNIAGLDIDNITHIRIIDVVGSINNQFGTRDGNGNIINDPWPTDFPSSGFDLDGLGIIHSTLVPAGISTMNNRIIAVYPNPATDNITINGLGTKPLNISILNTLGTVVASHPATELAQFDVSFLSSGMYQICIESNDSQVFSSFVKR